MEKHKNAGKIVKIEQGSLKGRYFQINDYIVNQFQGKAIERIVKSQYNLLLPVKRRGFPLDDKIVIGKLYPNMEVVCVHETELELEATAPTPVDLSVDNVTPIKRGNKPKKEKLQ